MPAVVKKYAVFFRNTNLGRPPSPTRAQLESAFLAAGAETASSFLTNGTLVFAATTESKARRIVSIARRLLKAECGLEEPAELRSVEHLAALVAAEPFSAAAKRDVYQYCVSFLSLDGERPTTPLKSKRGDLEIFSITASEAFSVVRVVGRSPGSPNAHLEKAFDRPATTRNWNTVVRLVQKYAE